MDSLCFQDLDLSSVEHLYRTDVVIVSKVASKEDPSRFFVLKQKSFDNVQELNEFAGEAYAMASLSHPYIVNVLNFEMNIEKRTAALLLDYYPEGDLAKLIMKKTTTRDFWTESELWRLFEEVIDTLAFLQENHLAHRDIKPQNFLVSTQNGVTHLILVDFGSATSAQASQTITGTPLYLSPELRAAFLHSLTAVPNFTYDAVRSDVFSLGLTFLHMASLREVRDLTNLRTLNETIEERLNSLKYDSILADFLRSMLRIQPADRPTFIDLRNRINGQAPTENNSTSDKTCGRCKKVDGELQKCGHIHWCPGCKKNAWEELVQAFYSDQIDSCPVCSEQFPD